MIATFRRRVSLQVRLGVILSFENFLSTTFTNSTNDSTSYCFWEFFIICAIRCSRSISFTSMSFGTCLFFNHCNAEAKRPKRLKTTTNFGKPTCSSAQVSRKCISLRSVTPVIRRIGGSQIALLLRRCCAAPDLKSSSILRQRYLFADTDRWRTNRARSTHPFVVTIMNDQQERD